VTTRSVSVSTSTGSTTKEWQPDAPAINPEALKVVKKKRKLHLEELLG
jgi:hypothetical protein